MKRPRVQTSESIVHRRSMVKTLENVDRGKQITRAKPMKTTRRKSSPPPQRILNDFSVRQGLRRRSPKPSCNHRPKQKLSAFHVEHTDRSMVEGALQAYREILTKANERNFRSHINAAMCLRNQGKGVNLREQLGAIPGVKVGDKFRYRAQLALVGLHRQFTCGIDYMKKDGKLLATSIVDSCRYANRMQSFEELTYSGQGGMSPFQKREPTDQELQRGNLALMNSKEARTPVRVLRRLKLNKGSCYVYYGLYIVKEVRENIGGHGKRVYEFVLRRMRGQPKLKVIAVK